MATDVTIAPRPAISTVTLSVGSSAVAMTVPDGARGCLIQADGGTLRVGLNSTPTSSAGIRLDDGVYVFIDADPRQVRLVSPSSATAQVVFFA